MRNKARFLLSKKKTIEQYEKACSVSDIVSYSFKTNFEIGRVLEESTDSMFTVHSIESAHMIKDKKRIWFLAQAWDEEEFLQVVKLGINKFVVDNEMDLQRLLEFSDKHNTKFWLLLRIRLKEFTIHTGKYYVYGMKTVVMKKWLEKLTNTPRIEKLGIHFHRKTQNTSEWSLKYELSRILDDKQLKIIDFVDIGGGLPVIYKNYRLENQKEIFEKIKELKVWLNSHNVSMILEPGRFIAAPPIVLEAKIMNIYDNNIVINCSVWNSCMDTFIANIRLLVKGEEEKGIPYTIKGNSPDSMDIIRYRVFLPEQKVGNTLLFLNAGAYNFHANFCNLPKLETVIVD